MGNFDHDAKMRDTPLTENELARFQMLKRLNKGYNPKWYKAPTLPKQFKFKPGAPPVIPRQARCTIQTEPPKMLLKCYGGPLDGESLALCTENGPASSLPMEWRGKTGRYEGTNTGAWWRELDDKPQLPQAAQRITQAAPELAQDAPRVAAPAQDANRTQTTPGNTQEPAAPAQAAPGRAKRDKRDLSTPGPKRPRKPKPTQDDQARERYAQEHAQEHAHAAAVMAAHQETMRADAARLERLRTQAQAAGEAARRELDAERAQAQAHAARLEALHQAAHQEPPQTQETPQEPLQRAQPQRAARRRKPTAQAAPVAQEPAQAAPATARDQERAQEQARFAARQLKRDQASMAELARERAQDLKPAPESPPGRAVLWRAPLAGIPHHLRGNP